MKQWLEDLRKRHKITREMPQYWDFPEQGFGYIQIPKAATRSIREALVNGCGSPADAAGEQAFARFEDRFSAHQPLTAVRSLAAGRRVVFAFVRNPYARLYSAYVNKIVDAEQAGRKNIFRCHGMSFGMSFEDFALRVCEIEDRRIDRHLRSQAWFLSDAAGLIPNFVGHLESFEEDWNRLALQVPQLQSIGHRNKASAGKDYSVHYSAALRERVYRRYQRDFELFGYQP